MLFYHRIYYHIFAFVYSVEQTTVVYEKPTSCRDKRYGRFVHEYHDLLIDMSYRVWWKNCVFAVFNTGGFFFFFSLRLKINENIEKRSV